MFHNLERKKEEEKRAGFIPSHAIRETAERTRRLCVFPTTHQQKQATTRVLNFTGLG